MKFTNLIKKHWKLFLVLILIVNFLIRLLIYRETNIPGLSDSGSYINGIETIHETGWINLKSGNFLYALSYLGYFAKYKLGSIDYFFYFNCLLGTIATFIISILVVQITRQEITGVITALILTFYVEFMVFSSVFYTAVIMLFLLSAFLLLLFYYLQSKTVISSLLLLTIILFVYLATFLFKPELVALPIFLLVLIFIAYKKKKLIKKYLILTIVLLFGIFLVNLSGIYNKNGDTGIGNDFVFFGHTDYGGDGGEGAFIYAENKARYDEAFKKYCIKNNLNDPSLKDRNNFHLDEIKRFIIQHPLKWTGIQFIKFFRTFGVVPESTSFKILYSGLLKDKLWLSAILVVAPVALIIVLFISLFNWGTLKYINCETDEKASANNSFFYIYILFFIYYLIATIFLGQYQERYRLPVMVVFLVPVLSYFIANFDKREFLNRTALIRKGIIMAVFLVIWIIQAEKTISNKERLSNLIESINNHK